MWNEAQTYTIVKKLRSHIGSDCGVFKMMCCRIRIFLNEKELVSGDLVSVWGEQKLWLVIFRGVSKK